MEIFIIIGTDGIVWYHDGMTSGISWEPEGDFNKVLFQKFVEVQREKIDLSSVCKS